MTDPRTATVPNRLETVRDIAAKAQTELAATCLNLDAVMGAISGAALEGFSTVTIAPPKLVDLRGTEAWRKAVEWLKQEGFGVEPKELPNRGGGPPAWALVVSW